MIELFRWFTALNRQNSVCRVKIRITILKVVDSSSEFVKKKTKKFILRFLSEYNCTSLWYELRSQRRRTSPVILNNPHI